MQASRRGKLFITQGLFREREDCTKSRKYSGVFSKLEDYLNELEKVYKISIPTLLNEEHTSESDDDLKHVLLSGFPLQTNKPYAKRVDLLRDHGVPIILISEEDVPCDFIESMDDKWRSIRFTCMRRDIEMAKALIKGEAYNGNIACYKDPENKLGFGNDKKLCERAGDFATEILLDALDSLNKLSSIQKLKKVPILRFSVFLDLMMWLYCLGEDIIGNRIQTVEVTAEAESNRRYILLLRLLDQILLKGGVTA